ncbi:WD40-repeat-containing domain protein [Scheffersomyces amazonensis]|uniref:WD40-repeat-containing domain protein n=1 Tax=Scheffersomyces amazonensis TaxID=1078765 RepID=UPI00315D9362
MADYYQPTLLFRRNAKRYSSDLSPVASMESLHSSESKDSQASKTSNNSSWMLNHDNPQDTEILNQSCSLNRLNIKSNYWKIPDNNFNLTSMAINNDQSDVPTLAISSGNSTSNLFIYELNLLDNYLTHHSTISLPNIYGMKWLNSKYLITGNSNGYAHLVSVPTAGSDRHLITEEDEDQAEIIKRFNHRKHLKNKVDIVNKTTYISKLTTIPKTDNLLSLYQNHLFFWDIKDSESSIRPSPVSITTINGINNFETIPTDLNTIGICGKFGISLFDLRQQPKFNVPTSLIAESSRQRLNTNLIKWNPDNEYNFAGAHGDNIIRLWDIRKQDSSISFIGHHNKVTSLEWNNGDLFSGGKDGNIIHWDLTSEIINQGSICSLKEGFDSVKFNPDLNKLETCINQRQCGTLLPASNTNIIGMASVKGSSDDNQDLKVLSIDGSSFFGVHSKIYDAINININPNKVYYTDEDIQLLMQSENSASTLVDNVSQDDLVEEIIKPLSISRKSTTITSPIKNQDNSSNDTLLGEQFTEDSHKLNIDMNKFNVPEVIEIKSEQDENEEEEEEEDIDEFDFTQPMYGINDNLSAYSIDSLDPKIPTFDSPSSHALSTTFDSLDTFDNSESSAPSSIHSSPEIKGLNHTNNDNDKLILPPTNSLSINNFKLLDEFEFDTFDANMFEIQGKRATTIY